MNKTKVIELEGEQKKELPIWAIRLYTSKPDTIATMVRTHSLYDNVFLQDDVREIVFSVQVVKIELAIRK